MTTQEQQSFVKIINRLKDIPLFSCYSEIFLQHNIKIDLLLSQTNKTYKIHIDGTNYLLKIPRAKTSSLIDHINKQTNTQVAFKLGLTPEVLWNNSKGIELIRYLENTRSLNVKDFHNLDIMTKLHDSLSKLHHSQCSFKGNLHDPETIRNLLQQYYNLCSNELKNTLNQAYESALFALKNIQQYDYPAVASHIDLIPENILIDKDKAQKIWLIDWEYSAMASPFWDIATVCNEGNFNDAQAKSFLKKIINQASKKDIKLLSHYRDLLGGLSLCWYGAFQKN